MNRKRKAKVFKCNDNLNELSEVTDTKKERLLPRDSLQALFGEPNKTIIPGIKSQVIGSDKDEQTPEKIKKNITKNCDLEREKEMFNNLFLFCQIHFLPTSSTPRRRLDRDVSSLTLSTVFIRKTPAYVLHSKPVIKLDEQLSNFPQFASVYAMSLHDYFKGLEVSEQALRTNYLEFAKETTESHLIAPVYMEESSRKKPQLRSLENQIHSSGSHDRTPATKRKQSVQPVLISPNPEVNDIKKYVLPMAITKEMRSLCIEVLISVAERGRAVLKETLHTAVDLMDRFLAIRLRRNKRLHTNVFASNFTSGKRCTALEPSMLLLVGAAALSLAHKYEESEDQSMIGSRFTVAVLGWNRMLKEQENKDMTKTSASSVDYNIGIHSSEKTGHTNQRRLPSPDPTTANFRATQTTATADHLPLHAAITVDAAMRKQTLASIANMEIEILETLEWQIVLPTAYTFLQRYMLAGQLNKRQCVVATCLCERSLLMHSLLQYRASMVAASVVSMVRLLFGLDGWSSTLAHYSHYKQNQLDDCIRCMQSALLAEEIAHFSAAQPASVAKAATTQAGIDTDETSLGHMSGAEVKRNTSSYLPASRTYIPGTCLRAKYSDEIYRLLVNLPITWIPVLTGAKAYSDTSFVSATAQTARATRARVRTAQQP